MSESKADETFKVGVVKLSPEYTVEFHPISHEVTLKVRRVRSKDLILEIDVQRNGAEPLGWRDVCTWQQKEPVMSDDKLRELVTGVVGKEAEATLWLFEHACKNREEDGKAILDRKFSDGETGTTRIHRALFLLNRAHLSALGHHLYPHVLLSKHMTERWMCTSECGIKCSDVITAESWVVTCKHRSDSASFATEAEARDFVGFAAKLDDQPASSFCVCKNVRAKMREGKMLLA